jgi:hypothetical protein
MPGVVVGTMFGYPAYYVNKKLFACLYEEGIGIKVPAKAEKKAERRGSLLFSSRSTSWFCSQSALKTNGGSIFPLPESSSQEPAPDLHTSLKDLMSP